MKLAPTRQLYAYWNVARRARPAPERGDLDLTTVRAALPDLIALERDPAGRRRVRHAGARLARLMGVDPSGSPFADLWEDGARAEAERLTALVEDDQQPIVAGVLARRGATLLPCELLLLPLRCGGRTHARMLGLVAAAVAQGEADAPARLGAIASFRLLGAGDWRGSDDGGRQRGRLRVYDGGAPWNCS